MNQCYSWGQRSDFAGISATIPGHSGEVTCVRFLRRDTIVSADNKGSIIVRREVTGIDGTSNVRVLLCLLPALRPLRGLLAFFHIVETNSWRQAHGNGVNYDPLSGKL